MKYLLQYFSTIFISLVLILACGGGGKSSDEEVYKIDSDKDGVIDSKDQCANTAKNAKVDDKGCKSETGKKTSEKTSLNDAKANIRTVKELFDRNHKVQSRNTTRKYASNKENANHINIICNHTEEFMAECKYNNQNYKADFSGSISVSGTTIINNNSSVGSLVISYVDSVMTGNMKTKSYGIVIGTAQSGYEFDGTYILSTNFEEPSFSIYHQGILDMTTEWESYPNNRLKRKIATAKLSDQNKFSILGDDNSGTEWTKMNISSELHYNPEMDKPFKILNNANYNQKIIRNECYKEYEIKTVSIFQTLSPNNHPSTGEMNIYNKTDNLLTKIKVISSNDIKLTSDVDNDGVIDYTKIISWNDLLNEKYNICN